MAELFTDDAEDQTDPFNPPVSGKENLRRGFAWWMRDQRGVHMTAGRVDVIGNRFYAEIDSSWTMATSGARIEERGLLVCDMVQNKARTMREFWKTRKT